MRIEPPNWAVSGVIFVVVVGTLLLADAGHFFWPVFLIIAGAYVVPTLYVRLRNFLATRGQDTSKNEVSPDK